MSTDVYHNSPVRSCETCVHFRPARLGPTFNRCARFQTYTEFATKESWIGHTACGLELREWRQAPPSRSFRRWLYDVFVK